MLFCGNARGLLLHLKPHVAADLGVVLVVGKRLLEADRRVQKLRGRWDSRTVWLEGVLDARGIVAVILTRLSLRFPLRRLRVSVLSTLLQIFCHQYLRRHDYHLQQLVAVLEVEEPNFAQTGAPSTDLV